MMGSGITKVGGVGLCLGISLLINVLQGTRILSLQGDVQRLLDQGDLLPGTPLPKFEANDLAGQSSVVDLRASPRPTILYVFSPSCGWCSRNSDNINSLAKQVSGRYRVLGVSLSNSGVVDYVKSHKIAFPVYTGISQATLTAYKLARTPETIVVSQEGKVVESWFGAYAGEVKTTVERFFAIHLPADVLASVH